MSNYDFDKPRPVHVPGAVIAMPSIESLLTVIEAGIESVQIVLDNWERGDLARAVNELEDWAVQAADYLPEEER